MRRFLSMFLAMLLVVFAAPTPAHARAELITLFDTQVVTDVTTPISVSKHMKSFSNAMLVIETTAETGDASLQVAIYATSPIEDTLICASAAITTNKVQTIWIGPQQAYVDSAGTAYIDDRVGSGIDLACTAFLPRDFKVTLIITGAACGFTVDAYLMTSGN